MGDSMGAARLSWFDVWAVAWLVSLDEWSWAAAGSAAAVACCILAGWVIGQVIGRRLLAWCESRRLGARGE